MLAWAAVVLALALGVLSSVVLVRRSVKERRETERVRAMFTRYVSPVVVDELLARKDPRIFEGRAGYATILFCRIWNFSLFSENLKPDETLRYLNEFYTLAGQSIHKHRGMIDKFLGDGVMAVFGMPLDDPHQEEHAIAAALDIVRLVAAMNGRWVQQGRKPFRVGIGINSGNVISGDTGFARRREYTVVGTEVAVASRLQEMTEEFGAFILASAATHDVVREMYSAVAIKNIPLRGMRRVQTAYVIRGLARHSKDDTLLLPPPGAFRTTAISEKAAPGVEASPPSAQAAPPSEPAEPAAAAPKGADDSELTRRRKRKRRLSAAPTPDIEKDLERDRFSAPQPEPRKSYYDRALIPPQREFAPATLEIPELAAKKRTFESAEPALPEIPAPPMTYEDGHGPPMELPP